MLTDSDSMLVSLSLAMSFSTIVVFAYVVRRVNQLIDFVNDLDESVSVALRTFNSIAKASEDSEVDEVEVATTQLLSTPSDSIANVNANVNANADPLTDAFNSELSRQSMTREQILQKGRDVGKEPVQFLTVQPGVNRYLTNDQLDNYRKTHETFKRLSPDDESQILREFNRYLDDLLIDVRTKLREDGYSVVVVRVNGFDLMSNTTSILEYDATRVSVAIRDPDYDMLSNRCSTRAVVDAFVAVGRIYR